MTDFQLSTPVTSPTAIRPVDRYELGDAIRNAWLKHGQDSWLTIADEVFAALAQPSPEGELTDEELAKHLIDACVDAIEGESDGKKRMYWEGWNNQVMRAMRTAIAADLLERLSLPQPVPVSEQPDQRHPDCVKAWPDCWDGGYDPRCCRFPKSCSCEVRYDLPLPPESTQAIEPQERTLLVPAAQPIPVSERLPGPEDCTTNPRTNEGRWCWGWVEHDPTPYSGRWRMMRREWLVDEATHWLPAHALPLPSTEHS